jgi:acetyl esterase
MDLINQTLFYDEHDPEKNSFTATAFPVILCIAGCNGGNSSTRSDSVVVKKDSVTMDSSHLGMIRPKGPKPAWAPDIHPEMQAVIEKLLSYNAPPIESLTAAEARKNPTHVKRAGTSALLAYNQK